MGKEPLEGNPKMASLFIPLETGKDLGRRRKAARKGGRPGGVARPQEEVPRAGAGREGVKAERGGSLWQEDTPVRRAEAGGAQVRRLCCPAGEEGRRRVEAKLAVGG